METPQYDKYVAYRYKTSDNNISLILKDHTCSLERRRILHHLCFVIILKMY